MYCDDGIVEFWENQRFWGFTWGAPLLPFDWPAWSDSHGNAVQLGRPPEREGERSWFIVRTLGTDEEGWQYSTIFSKLKTPRPGGRASKRSSDYVRSRVWRKLAADTHAAPDQELQSFNGPPWSGGSAAVDAPPDGNDTIGGGGRGLAAVLIPDRSRNGNLPTIATMGAAGATAAAAAAASAAVASAGSGARPQPRFGLQPEAERILRSAVAAVGVNSRSHGESGGALPKPSLFKLWQLFMELWNDACARHGMRRLVPLDPLGLYVAARRHRELLARQRVAQLATGRLLAAAPVTTEVEPDLLDEPCGGSGSQDEDVQQEVRLQSAAALGELRGAEAAGVGSQQAAQAAVAAAAAAAAAVAAQHRSPTVGETPTGAAIMQPAAPQPITLHGGGRGARHRTASITGPPGGSAGCGGSSGDMVLSADQGLMPDLTDPATLLTELVTAANYARSAYGYVMAAGHLNSLTKVFTMLSSSAHFNPITGASAEANLGAIHLFTGIPVEDVVMAEWRSSVFCPCHYLAVDRRRRRLVLAIRGSLELADIATDLTARPVEYDFGGGLVGHVHQGLMSAASYVQGNTAAALQSAADRFPGWPLLVTGHSLGAGVAALLTLLLLQRDRPMAAPAAVPVVHCLAIAPPAVLSANLAEAARDCCVSVVNHGDIVPRLSCYSVDRALLELVQASPAAQMADNLLQSTGATLAAIQQGLAALGGAAAAGVGVGFGGVGVSGFGGSFLNVAGLARRGAGRRPVGDQSAPNLGDMELEMVSSAVGGGGDGGGDGRGGGVGGGGGGGVRHLRHGAVRLQPPPPSLPPGGGAAAAVHCCAGLKDIPLLTAAGSCSVHHHHPRLHHHHHHHHYHQTSAGDNNEHLQHQNAYAQSAQAANELQQRLQLQSSVSNGSNKHRQHPQLHPALAAAGAATAGGDSSPHRCPRQRAVRRRSHFTISADTDRVLPPPLLLPLDSEAVSDIDDDGADEDFGSADADAEDDFSVLTAVSRLTAFSGAAESIVSFRTAASNQSSNQSYFTAAGSPISRKSTVVEESQLGDPQWHATATGLAAAAAAAAVGGVPYAGHLAAAQAHIGAQAEGHHPVVSPKGAVPTPFRFCGGDDCFYDAGSEGSPLLANDRYAALTPPSTSPLAPPPMVSELNFRRNSDPLALRGPSHRVADIVFGTGGGDSDGCNGGDGGDGGGGGGAAAGLRDRFGFSGGSFEARRMGSQPRGDGGDGGVAAVDGASGSLISWEAFSQKLMASWFGPGFFGSEEEEAADGGGDAARRAAEGGGSHGGLGGGWLTSVIGTSQPQPPASTLAGAVPSQPSAATDALGLSGSGMTSCWSGLEEPPGPHRSPDAAGTILRGKYGAVTHGSDLWPWAGSQRSPPSQNQAAAAAAARASNCLSPRQRPQLPQPQPQEEVNTLVGGNPVQPAADTVDGGANSNDTSRRSMGQRRVGHRHSRSVPAPEMPDSTAALDGGFALEVGGKDGPAPRGSEWTGAAARGANGAGAATGVAGGAAAPDAGGGGGSAEATAAPAVPHYIHSAHKELYPPGRLLWMLVDNFEALPLALRQKIPSCGYPGLSAAAAGGARDVDGGGGNSNTTAQGGRAAATATAAAATATAAEAVAGDPVRVATTAGEVEGSQDHNTPAVEDGENHHYHRRHHHHHHQQEGDSLLDLSLVTDLRQDSAACPPVGAPLFASAGPGAGVTAGGGDLQPPPLPGAAAPCSPSKAAVVGTPLQVSRRSPADPATATAAAAVAVAAEATGSKRQRGSLCREVQGSEAADAAAAAGATQPRRGSSSGGSVQSPRDVSTSGDGGVCRAELSPLPLTIDACAASVAASVAVVAGGGGGSSSGGGGGGPGSMGPFTARVRESLKRIKSGVETILRQTPMTSVSSMQFLQAASPPPVPRGDCSSHGAGSASPERRPSGGGAATSVDSDAAPLRVQYAVSGRQQQQPQQQQPTHGSAQAQAQGQWVFLVEADREVFERMVLIPASVMEHLPDAYFQRLRQLVKGSAAAATAARGP